MGLAKKWLTAPAAALCLISGTAFAATESLHGDLPTNGTVHTYGTVRTVTHNNASLDITLNDTTDGTTNLSLLDVKTGNKLGRTVSCSNKCDGTFATQVRANTRFKVTGRISNWSWYDTDNDWSGVLAY